MKSNGFDEIVELFLEEFPMDFFSASCIDINVEFILENFLDDLRSDFEALAFLSSES